MYGGLEERWGEFGGRGKVEPASATPRGKTEKVLRRKQQVLRFNLHSYCVHELTSAGQPASGRRERAREQDYPQDAVR